MNKRVSHKKLKRANKKLNIQMSATRLLQTLVNQTYVQTFFSFLCFPSTVTKKSFWLPCKNAYKEKQRSIHGTSYSKWILPLIRFVKWLTTAMAIKTMRNFDKSICAIFYIDQVHVTVV